MGNRYEIIRGDLLYKTVHTIYNDVQSELSFSEINIALRYSHPDIVIWLFRNDYKNIKEFDSTFNVKSTITFDILDKAIKKYCTLVNQNLEEYTKNIYNIRDIKTETDIEKTEREKNKELIQDQNNNCLILRLSCINTACLFVILLLFI